MIGPLGALLLIASPTVGVDFPPPDLVPLDCGRGHADGGEARGGARPLLSGEVFTVDSEDGFFRVHWTTDGEDRVAEADQDGNDVPDYVDRTLAGLEEGRALFGGLGYRGLLPDEGLGGSTGLDAYVRDIDAFGYAHPVETGVELPAHSCFMEIDNAIDGQGDGVLTSVAVHELHHCIQYTYTPFTSDWLYEATATFEQYRDRSSGALDAALEFLWVFRLRDHDRPLAATGDRYEYAGFLFLKFWEELGHDVRPSSDTRRVPDLWEAVALQPRWEEALNTESRSVFDQGFDRTFRDFATWNLFACSRADGLHYDGATYPCTLPNTSVPVEPLPIDAPLSIDHEEAAFTATFYEAAADGDDRPLELTCEGPGDDAQLRLRLLALDAAGVRGEHADLTIEDDEGGTVRLEGAIDPGGAVALVAASTGEAPPQAVCSAARVDAIGEGEGCECSSGGTPRGSAAALGWFVLLGLRARSRASRASSSR